MRNELGEELVEMGRQLVREGLTRGSSGNLSARITDGGGAFLLTPSGARLDQMAASDLVVMSASGQVVAGVRPPSSEWRIHLDIYRSRPEVRAVAHAHPPFSTTIACLRRDLPAVHYEIGFAGGHDVRCAEYATFGTEELSRNALSAMEGRTACLLANHGLVTVGESLTAAIRLARTIETVAEIYWRALAAGDPVILDREEMDRVVARFATYGR
jgi:L-fuculose-phosphate aldolase